MSLRRLIALLMVLSCTGSLWAGEPKPKSEWKVLFDGKTLTNWKASDFLKGGKVAVEEGAIVMQRGNRMSGITYDKTDFPKMNYEFEVEAKRVDGKDFFATTTFPVGDSYLSFVTGGWGGTTIGLSSINGADASENSTMGSKEFDLNKYYKFRVRVTEARIEAFIDNEQMVDLETRGLKFSIRIECDPSKPFGISAWNTVSAIRAIRVRNLTAEEVAEAKNKKKD